MERAGPKLNSGDGVTSLVLGDTHIVLWKAPASLERWKWLMAQTQALSIKFPEGMLRLDFILGTSSPPDARTVSKFQADLRDMGPRLRRYVVVPVGDTVWLSIVRSIVRTALIITGLSKQHSVAATTAEGVTRLLEAARANTPSRKQLVDAVDVLFKAGADSRVTLDSRVGS
jgi:hypothetical protein